MLSRSRVLHCLCQRALSKYQRVGVECSKVRFSFSLILFIIVLRIPGSYTLCTFFQCIHNIILPSAKLHSQQAPTQRVKIKAKENVQPVNKFANRTHTCGELAIDNVDENVRLCGWLEFQRMGKFLILRDAYGSTQCIIDEQVQQLFCIWVM